MPLLVPDVSSTAALAKTQDDWSSLLVGKVLTEDEHSDTQFATRELPENSRVVEPGSKVTRDHVEDRLNVHVDADKKVTHVSLG